MNYLRLALLGAALGSTVSIASECVEPELPNVPDGAAASMEDMLSGQKAVKAFQAANLEYMGCLEKEFTTADAARLEGSDDDKASAEAAYTESTDAYNSAVSKEEDVAGQFNTAIRQYKEANPG